jgi:hypothetical protein
VTAAQTDDDRAAARATLAKLTPQFDALLAKLDGLITARELCSQPRRR